MKRVRALGCIACYNMGVETPEQFTCIHHIEGQRKPGAHFKVIGLCDGHHSRYEVTGLHYNLREWENEYGTQEQLLEQIEEMLV